MDTHTHTFIIIAIAFPRIYGMISVANECSTFDVFTFTDEINSINYITQTPSQSITAEFFSFLFHHLVSWSISFVRLKQIGIQAKVDCFLYNFGYESTVIVLNVIFPEKFLKFVYSPSIACTHTNIFPSQAHTITHQHKCFAIVVAHVAHCILSQCLFAFCEAIWCKVSLAIFLFRFSFTVSNFSSSPNFSR